MKNWFENFHHLHFDLFFPHFREVLSSFYQRKSEKKFFMSLEKKEKKFNQIRWKKHLRNSEPTYQKIYIFSKKSYIILSRFGTCWQVSKTTQRTNSYWVSNPLLVGYLTPVQPPTHLICKTLMKSARVRQIQEIEKKLRLRKKQLLFRFFFEGKIKQCKRNRN